jgi:hypothetical protein
MRQGFAGHVGHLAAAHDGLDFPND